MGGCIPDQQTVGIALNVFLGTVDPASRTELGTTREGPRGQNLSLV